ncbi:valine--tRNA ligase [Candidatus Daviesbacteria bacterium]|nr:valine--tRNA ligase [Candidatus Daviesbacteria bacterium]
MDKPKTKIDRDLYEYWEKSGFFKADPDSAKTPYSLLIPPPNVNGPLHLGHAMQHAILDCLARFKRMQGFDVLLLPGVDHAGILFEGTLNKLLEKEGLSKQKLGREEWMKRAWQFKDENYQAFHDTWKLMGLSADWSREVFTLEPKVQKAVLEEFKTFWDQDLLYKGAYIVQWCPKDQTAIEDLEMEYEERQEKFYYIRYKIDGSDDFILIATARPETIAADVAVAIYPNHPKFAKLIGKMAKNPFTATKIPIIEDKRVEKDFGTGALKITPGHDLLDYEIGKTHKLPILHVVSKEGHITNLDPNLNGLKIIEARDKAAGILNEKGLIEKVEEYTHSVPVCERCKTTIEPLISEEWFVKMKPLAQKALKNIGKICFLPKNYHKIISDWLKEIHDWSISRSLWWGHRIPVWYCQKCNPSHEVGKDKDMVISLEEPKDPDSGELKKCQTCRLSRWVQDEQVLDTWFSSGLWPMATLGWFTRRSLDEGGPNRTKELERYYPWDFELTAPEIKFLWIARMIMLGLWFMDEIPFKNMFFHGMLRDLQGRKFSKSLGNGIDPYELVEQWGTDAARMALYSYSAPGRDAKTSRQIMDERCKNYRNFGTKLRNITRFVIDLAPEKITSSSSTLRNDVIASEAKQSKHPDERSVHNDDRIILEQLNQTISEVTKNIESFNLHLATEKLYSFIWHDFADIYIEDTKNRRAQAQPTLEHVLKTSLQLLHPFMPFLTEELWLKILSSVEGQKLPHINESIMLSNWPGSIDN